MMHDGAMQMMTKNYCLTTCALCHRSYCDKDFQSMLANYFVIFDHVPLNYFTLRTLLIVSEAIF